MDRALSLWCLIIAKSKAPVAPWGLRLHSPTAAGAQLAIADGFRCWLMCTSFPGGTPKAAKLLPRQSALHIHSAAWCYFTLDLGHFTCLCWTSRSYSKSISPGSWGPCNISCTIQPVKYSPNLSIISQIPQNALYLAVHLVMKDMKYWLQYQFLQNTLRNCQLDLIPWIATLGTWQTNKFLYPLATH